MDTPKREQTYFYWALLVIGLLVLTTALITRPLLADVLPQSAYQQLQAVWQRAGASPQYDYHSTILQTTIPTARLSNAGRSNQTQRIRIDGNLDKTADIIQMELQVGQREPVAIKIEDGQAYGRHGNGDEWSALEQMPDLFAPAGDPLGFLAAMDNVRVLGPNDPGLEDISAPAAVRAARDGAATGIDRYAFDLSGPKFAAFMKAQMEEQLRRSGALPPSVSLSTPAQYVGMTGQGELFVNDAGLPARLLIHIDLPPQAGGDSQTAADMVTVFAQWAEPVDHVWTQLWRDPTLITAPSVLVGIDAQTAQQSGLALGMTIFILGGIALALSYRRLWAVRAVIYSLIILSMVITPLLQTQQVSAFYDGQQARALAAARNNVGSNMAANLEADVKTMESAAFNPHESPVQVTSQAVAAAPAATANNVSAAQIAATCTITESSDCDGDGLLDQVEIYQLGTLVDVIDTDGDKISDKAEIQPMIVGGETWYLDPLSSDSNGDGLADSMECSARVDMVLAEYIATDSYATCPDTDSDGVPDIFDFDNDGDGVPDSVDGTPNAAQAVTDKRFGLALAGYETGRSLYVNLELRPTNDRHLWWHDSALDWPDNDLAGQIQRVTDETVDGDGDMRLSPMLEVAIPYDAANPTRGLPMRSGVDPATVGQSTPLADWLDQERLDAYGIVLSGPSAEDGLIYLYVPLTVIQDEVGDTPVAFGAALLYEMAGVAGSWGADHEMRLLWVVNGLNDNCEAPEGLSEDEADTYCADHANWISKATIYQTYYDDFLVTSLTVQQDLGASALIIAANGASAAYESDLWHLVDTLQETYLEAQTVSGERLTPGQIPDHLDAWGINSSNLTIASYTDLHDKTALAQALTGQNVQTALTQSHSGVAMDTVANLLFVGEETTIDASLATTATTYSANTLQVDLTDVARQTTGFVRWNPYQYTVTTIPNRETNPDTGLTTVLYTQIEQWDELNVATYVEQLQSDLATVLTKNVLVAAGLATAADDADLVSSGAAGLAGNYYLTQYIGAPAVLANSSFPLTGDPLVDADHVKPAEPVVTIVARLVALLQETFAQKSLANLDIETDASGAELVANSTWQTLATSTGAILTGVGALLAGSGGSSVAAALATTAAPPAPTTQLAGTDLSDAATLAFSRAYFGSIWTGVGTEGAVDAVRLAISIRSYYKFVTAQRAAQNVDRNIRILLQQGDPFGVAPRARELANKSLDQAKSAQRSMKFWAAVGLAVDLAVIGIFTTYTIIANDLEPGSPAFNQVLAMAYAQALVATLTFALLFLLPGANIVLAVILFIDAIVSVVCEATGVKQDSTKDAGYWLCGGITGLLAKALVYVVNDTTQLMDLTKSDHLAVGFQAPVLTVTADTGGAAVGNTLSLTADITNTAYAGKPNWMGYFYPWQLRDENVKESTVDVRFQSSATGFDDDLALGGTAWQRPADYSIEGLPPYPGARYVNSYQRTIDYTMDQAGVNVGLPYFLSEGVKVKQQDCWLYIGPPFFYPIPICQTEETFHDTFHQNLADFFVLDVFPATLADFHAVAPDVEGALGMRLAWDSDFPVLRDADNDGLVSAAFNGPDPDDSTPDTDGDGLGDFYEVQNGFDATSADVDCDGLTDYWEAFYNTDPKLADTDQDGLPDSQERFHPNWRYPYENHSFTNRTAPACAADAGLVAGYEGGWGIVYAYSGNTPLHLRVSADPRSVDADGDGLTDRQEQVYGYSPHAPSELKVLTLESAIDTGRGLGPYVTSSDTIAYEATVTNELSGRYLRGLLESELPVDNVIKTQEIDGLLPLASTTLSGDIAVAAAGITASQATSLTLRAGAIVDTVPDHLLWLRFNEAAGATRLVDSSVYGTPILSQNVTSNGQYAYLQAPDALIIAAVPGMEQSTGGFSVGVWFKLTATNTGTTQWLLHGQKNGNGSDQGSPYLYVDGAGSLQAYLVEGTPKVLASAAGAVSANEWHHALATFDGTAANLYLDGALVDSGASGPLPTTPRMFLTGNPTFWGGAATYTPYYLDDVEVYGTVLDAQTVRDRYGKESIQNDLRSTDSSLSCVGGSCPTFNAAGATFNQTQRLSLNTAALDFSANQFSIAVNMKPRARTYPFDILGRNHFGRDRDHDWQAVYGYQAPNNSNLIFPSLYVGDNGALRVDMGGGANTCSYETAAGIVNFNVEQHVTVSYDGTTFTIYINGEERAAGSPPACGGIQIPNTNALFVGAPNGNGYLNIASVNFTALTDPLNAPAGAEVRLNVNGDGAANNVWSGSVAVLDGSTNNVEQVFNYGAVLGSSDSYSFRLWEDDNGSHNNAYESGDDSFVHETGVTYTSLKVGTLAGGATGTTFDIDSSYRARGTLYWSLSNDNFVGTLRNLRIYDYALSGPSAARLYNTETLALQMRFDEAPGESRFVDESGNYFEAECITTSCPDSGIPGRRNQALRFDGGVADDDGNDGVADYLTLAASEESLGLAQNNFTLMAWVKPDAVNGVRRILAAERTASGNGIAFGLNGGNLLLTTFGVKDYRSTQSTIPTGAWSHVAVSFDVNNDAHFYVNGQFVETITGSAPANLNSDDLYRIGAATVAGQSTTSEVWDGLIDELRIIKYAMDGDGIRAMMNEAPLLNLHLDEDLGATSFANDAPSAADATCTSNSCPHAGDKGQIREAATFGGDGYYLDIADGDTLDLDRFSIALWVKPTQTRSDYQPLLVKETSGVDRNYGLFIRPDSMQLTYGVSNCTTNTTRNSNGALLRNQWNHVVMTYDGSTARVYLNGALDGSALAVTNPCHNNAPIRIGDAVARYTGFVGSLDEITIEASALTAAQVAALYNYQSAWYDEKQQHTILVDDDAPVSSLVLESPYIAPGTVLVIQAEDPVVNGVASGIAQVEYNLNNGGWTQAVVEKDTYFIPAAATANLTEGSYTVQVRATDNLGHQADGTGGTIQIDTFAPTISPGDALVNDLVMVMSDTSTFYGSSVDTQGTVQSRVDQNSIQSTLRDHRGALVSGPLDVLGFGTAWAVNHRFATAPYGQYSLAATGNDYAGNQGSGSTMVWLDGLPGYGDMLGVGNIITGTGTIIRGLASDIPYPQGGRMLHLHFEEAAGATLFYDGSANHLNAACGSTGSTGSPTGSSADSCPTAGVTGQEDGALSFDGGDYLTIGDQEGITAAEVLGINHDFTVMAWVKPNALSGVQQILAAEQNNSPGGIAFGLNADKLRLQAIGVQDYATTASAGLTAGVWNHVAVSYDAAGNSATFYVNGVRLETVSGTTDLIANSDDTYRIGENFSGAIDELVIYDINVAEEEIYDIVHPAPNQTSQIKVRYRHAGGVVWPSLDPDGLALYLPLDEDLGSDEFADLSIFGRNATCSAGHCPTANVNSRVHPVETGAQIEFDSGSDYLTVPAVLDPATTDFTASLWFFATRIFDRDPILLQQADGSGVGRSWLYLTRDGKLNSFLGGSTLTHPGQVITGNWHHAAVTYDHATQLLTLYLDGVPVTDTRSVEANDGEMLIGAHEEVIRYFQGQLDEVAIFQRTLTDTEIGYLMATPWHDASPVYNSLQSGDILGDGDRLREWSHEVPVGLEGPYKIDLLVADGPVPDHRESANIGIWTGIIDTLAPRVTFEYVSIEPLASASATDANALTAQVRCSAYDDHLTATAWLCPVDNSSRTEQYQDAAWYTTRLTDTQMVIGFDTLQATVLADLDASMTACDLYGQCTTCDLTGQCTTFVTEPIRYARTLAIEDVSRAEGNGGTTAFTFAVRLHGAVAGGLTVDYTTVDGSATAPGDYTATSGTLTFAGTDGETQTITVLVNGDGDFEPDESFSVLLENLQGGGLNVEIADDTAIGTIEDDDGTSLFIDDVSQVEGDSGTTAFAFTVRLRGGTAGGLTVDYTTVDDTATAPEDYTATNGTLTFSGVDGETQTITVLVNGDMDVEADESFSVLLNNLQGSEPNIRIGDDTGIGTIENDDGSSLAIDDVSQVEGDSGTTAFVFTVQLSNDVAGGLTVDYTTADGSATAPDDYTATSGTLTFAGSGGETQTITVQVNGDTAVEADEIFNVLLSNLQGGGLNVGIADATGVGTIKNDDGTVVDAESYIFLPLVANQFDLVQAAEAQRDRSATETVESAPTEAGPDATEGAPSEPTEADDDLSDETVELSHQLFLPLVSSDD